MTFQSLVFPPVARRFGTLRTVVFAFALMSVTYAIIPFTTLIEDPRLRQIALFGAWMCKTFSTTFAFPGCTILLTNTASSIRILGTVNGITTSIGALGRAIGPTIVGYAFTWGVHHGYLVAPFWILAVLGLCALVPLIWAVEGDGFGDEGSHVDDNWVPEHEEFHDDDGTGHTKDIEDSLVSPTGAMRLRKTSFSQTSGSLNEEDRDEVAPLTRVQTPNLQISRTLSTPESFAAVISDTEDDIDDDNKKSSQLPSTGLSRGRRRPPTRRRSSTPLGSGPGFRKLSSNLGATMSGYGSGSELGG
jgi:hypothetical protein